MQRILFSALGSLFLSFAAVLPLAHAEQSFNDLPSDHPAYAAAEYLKTQGIISGYADGTFQPDRKVNRAEALKIIIAPLVKPEQLAEVKSTVFTDVAPDAWFIPYIEAARQNGIIDGPPKKEQFLGGNTVVTAEFFKMLELAHQVDPTGSFSDIKLPMASDVADTQAWFYPYMRYALTSSMVMIGQDGLLHPAQELTRGDTAIYLYRFLMYKQARRTQALLSEAENELIVILGMLEQDNLPEAQYASARALLAARGAHFKRPDEVIVQGAVKITEAFRQIVLAYGHGRSGELQSVVDASGEAWKLADRAIQLDASLETIGKQVQQIAKNMADSAREAMSGT
ncbi:hypothetical protein COU80_00040 [Candidatus Peregrinibacteria bacterium CG10_big_fil_rev_8_21_14_0_10_55_24]|nr:MAG: hypothetical protein COU80_00040 [Candidatus Peregrinibacteria bacterium CG10_big_fil_rev_8_21_14_0_10_55_24]